MEEKEIFIFTNDDKIRDLEEDFFNNYINNNFSEYALIITEDNSGFITNEENDAFMVMEYL